MDARDVRYEVDGRVARITLDRPRYRNAQSWQLLDQLDEAFDAAQNDKEVRVVVVQGNGEHFSAGHDLGTPEQIQDLRTRGVPDVGIGEYETFRKYNLDLTLKWRNLPKPTVALVRGYCIYGGWMIAAAMDVVFAAPSARFLAGQVEYLSVPFDVGFRKAKELLFEARFISGIEAHELGLVNRVMPADQLEDEVMSYAERVAQNDPFQLRMTKLAVNQAQDTQGFTAHINSAHALFMLSSIGEGDPAAALPERERTHRRPMVQRALDNQRLSEERAGR